MAFAIRYVTPPELLFVISEERTVDGVRHFAFALQGLFAPENKSWFVEKVLLSYKTAIQEGAA